MRKGLVALAIGSLLLVAATAVGLSGGHSQIVLHNVTPHKVFYWVTWINPVDEDGNPLMHWIQYADPDENYDLKWKLVPVRAMQIMGGELQPNRTSDSGSRYLVGKYYVTYQIRDKKYTELIEERHPPFGAQQYPRYILFKKKLLSF